MQAYGYDGLQRLTSDTVTSASGTVLASEQYGYDGDGNVAYDPSGNQTSAKAAGGTGYQVLADQHGDTRRVKGGKRVPIVRTDRDIEVANSLISAIDDAQAGNCNGAGNYPGLGGC